MLEVGQYLQQGRYRIRDRLNQGGMGTVYLAADRNLSNRLVAIKENSDSSAEAQEQFQAEAVILARLTHPNLPRVTDHFVEQSGRQYLVMDYVAGEDLRQTLNKAGGPLPEGDVLVWMTQVMDALEYMHSWVDNETGAPSPIIHRDIKPSNIKRTPDGRIVLVDFGVAKYQTDYNTQIGARAFTSGYSPIEQYTGGTDVRSDIYALGATIYTLLTDVKPPDSLAMVGGRTIAAPRKLNPEISRGTEKVILRAMQLQAGDRYQSIHEMREALGSKRIANLITERRAAGSTNRLVERPVVQPNQRSWFWFGGLALIGVISIALTLILLLVSQGITPTATPTADGATVAGQVIDTPTITPTQTFTVTATSTANLAVTAIPASSLLTPTAAKNSPRPLVTPTPAPASGASNQAPAADLATLTITGTPTLTSTTLSPPTPALILQPTATRLGQ
ncbi:MAG: protein kinase [Caldilineaceae bacterium]